MSYKYKLKFIPTALREWEKLDGATKLQFKKKNKRTSPGATHQNESAFGL